MDDKSSAISLLQAVHEANAAKHVPSLCSLIKKVFGFCSSHGNLLAFVLVSVFRSHTASVHHVRENQFTDRKKCFYEKTFPESNFQTLPSATLMKPEDKIIPEHFKALRSVAA